MLFSLAECIIVYDEHVTRSHNFSFAYVIAVIPLVYVIVYTSYKLLSRMSILHHCVLRYTNQIDEGRRACSVGDLDVKREAYTDSREGEPLLTTASNLGRRYGSDI